MTRQGKSKELHELWKRHLEAWAGSSLSQAEYCRQNELSYDKFNYWKRKFKHKNLPVKFVQIKPDPGIFDLGCLKMNIGPGLQIEIPDGFCQATLEKVLMTLKVL